MENLAKNEAQRGSDILRSWIGKGVSVEAEAALGDPRRTRRLKRLVEVMAKHPERTYPEQFSDPSELEAFYRFIRNKHVAVKDILAAHRQTTVARAESMGAVLVLHDTTECSFAVYDNVVREGLCRLSTNRQGFLSHMSLVVSDDGTTCPLGVVAMRPFPFASQLVDQEAATYWEKAFGTMESVYDRWLLAIKESHDALKTTRSVIHVADREVDAYQHLHGMQDAGLRYVFRLAQDRSVLESTSQGAQPRLSAWLKESKPLGSLPITLSAKGPRPHDPRRERRRKRQATVALRAGTVEIPRPKKRPELNALPKSLVINVVEAIEINPPAGEKPLRWVLATSEAITSKEAAARIVTIYRSRWLIEEFFKAIKTGCGYTKRQLESAQTLLVALAMTLPIAWKLLAIRYLSREAPTQKASAIVTPIQLKILQSELPKWPWEAVPTIASVTLAIARLGGHLPHNGPPGWQILGRGLAKLYTMERGWLAATQLQTCDQS